MNSQVMSVDMLGTVRGVSDLVLNIVSLRRHLNELQVVMDSHQFDILGLNETRLDKDISDSEVRIDGYDIYRGDQNTSGGGVAIYVNQNIPHFQRTDVSITALEVIGIDFEPSMQKFLSLFAGTDLLHRLTMMHLLMLSMN